MTRSFRWHWLGLFLLLGGTVGWADSAPTRLTPLIVSARAWPEGTEHLPAAVSVWRPETDAWGWTGGLPDLAAETPGVSRAHDGPWAGDLSIRGLTGDRIVITLDGARLVTATDLAARMALIDLSTIEQIEVFKGPVSALYGSGSLGGIVNLVPPPPTYSIEPVIRQRMRAGALHNPDGWTAHYHAAQHAPRHFSSATLTVRDVNSYRDGDGTRVRNTQYADQALSLRLGYRWTPDAETDVWVQYHRGEDIGIPGTGSAPLPTQADVTYKEARRWLVNLNNRLVVDGPYWKTSRLNLYYQHIERKVQIDNFPEGPIQAIRPTGRHDTLGARWLNEFELSTHQFGAGLETWRRELDSTRDRILANGTVLSDRPLPSASEWSYGGFVEDRWVWHPDWSLTLGARADGLRVENKATPQWDADSYNGLNWNAHAGVRRTLGTHGALRIVSATGYRAPSLEERYQFLTLGGGQTKLGNPDLDAERSRFVEAGFEWANSHWSLDITGFVNALHNRVGEERVDEQTIRNANVDRARIQGAEAETRWAWSDALDIQATLAYLQGDDRSANEPLPDIAPLTSSLGLRYRPATAWTVRLRYLYNARQQRVPTGMEETPGWGRADASVAYQLQQGGVEHTVRLDILNVTDATYRKHLQTWRGTPHNEPGRSIQLAWQATF